MANLGNYQVVDEMYRTAFGSVCTAKPADGAPTSTRSKDFVAKIFDPPTADGISSPSTESSAGSSAFMRSVKAQQQVAASSLHWAPIHDSGNGENKPFFVTNYYPRTAQKLLSGKVILNSIALHEILQSVVKGLVEFKQICGRAHGNIKPSNVLIAGRGELADGKVVLTDPAGEACTGADAEADDMLAVGGLLYHMVMHKPVHKTAWPVADSEEWKRLGRRGNAWRQLCSDLLNPDPVERPDLASLNRKLQSLLVRRLPVGKIAATLLIGGMLAAAGGWGAMKWEQGMRAQVAAAQDQWFSVLQDPSHAGLLESDPHLAPCLAEDRSHHDLIQTALDAEGWAALKPAVIKQVMAARTLSPESHRMWSAAIAKEAGELSDSLTAFRGHGWKMPEQLTQAPALPDVPAASDIIAGAAQLHDVRTRLAANDPTPRWSALEQHLTTLKNAKTDFAAAFAELLRTNAAGAITLSDKSWIATAALQQSDALALKLIEKRQIIFDRKRFVADEPGINLTHPTLADVEHWLATVDLYVKVAGGKIADDCAKELDAQVINGVKTHPDQWPKSNTKAFSDQQGAIDQKLTALRGGDFVVKDLRLDQENKGPLFDARTSIRQQIATLRQQFYVSPENPAEFVNGLAALDVKSAALRDIWDRQIADLRSRKPSDFTIPQWTERKAQVQELAKLLKKFDEFAAAPELISPYREIVAGRRDAELNPLIKQLGDGASLTTASAQALETDVQKASGMYAQWCNQVKDLAGDFQVPPAKDQILELTRFPDQTWRDSQDPATKEFWQTQVMAAEGPFHSLLAPYLARLDSLRAVQASDLPGLTAIVLQTAPRAEPEVFIAAWRRLASEGQLARPATIPELKNEGVIRENLTAIRAAIDKEQLSADPSLELGKRINQELSRGLGRWCDAFKSAQSVPAIAEAMGVRYQFGMSDPALLLRSADLGAEPRYNAWLWLAEDSFVTNNDAGSAVYLASVRDAAGVLPKPNDAYGAMLSRWLKAQPISAEMMPQFKAVLDQTMFCLPGQQPQLLPPVLAAAGKLRDQKNSKQALTLLMGFFQREGAGVPESGRVQWAKQFYDLATSLSDPKDAAWQVAALTESTRLQHIPAMTLLRQVDPLTAAKEFKVLADAGNIDATVFLADMYDRGTGVKPSIDEARRLYTIADGRHNKKAHDWLLQHPVQTVVVKTDPPKTDPPKTDPPPNTDPPKTDPPKTDPPPKKDPINKIKIRAGN